MSCSRKSLALVACTALLCSGQAQDDATKKAKTDFLKQHEQKKPAPAKPAPKPATGATRATTNPAKTRPTTPRPTPGPLRLTVSPTPAPNELPKISLPIPKGQDSIGVTIPMYDGGTKKTMNFKIGVATRLDDKLVKMKNLEIDTYAEDGSYEMSVALPGAVLDLNTRVITGDETCTIKRSDFELTGQAIQFNTQAKQGWIKGKVKMTIFDLSEDTGAPPPTPKS